MFFGAFLRWSAVGFAVAGTAVLLSRTVYALEPLPLPVLALPIAIALAVAWWIAAGRRMSESSAAAWVDVQAGGDGLVVTGQETSDPRWSAAFEKALGRSGRLPGLRVGRPAGQSFGAAAFLVAALFVRIPAPAPGPSPELFEAAVASLQDKLDTLLETVDLDAELAENLADRLSRLEELLADASPESIFEAIDSLEERFGLEGERLGDAMESAAKDLAAALLDRFNDPDTARASLERALSALRDAGLGKDLPESLAELLGQDLTLPEGIEFDPAQLLELTAELSQLMQDRMGALAKVGLFDPSLLGALTEFADLAEFLPTYHECDEDCEEGG